MHHRGPDDDGSFVDGGVWLAHRRLSIIDLSDAAHQPLIDRETGVALVYNGEIFNYVELRAELEAHGHRFTSHSDTEVLLRSYLQWDRDCVRRFNGMWAFVIWDPRRQRAFFSRDRFGIKPLFIARVGDAMALASEPKALLELYPQLRRPDVAAIARLLAEKRVYVDGRSFYEGISVFPAAHCGTFSPGDRMPKLERYWDFPQEAEPGAISLQEARREFRELFESSVALRLRSDVPLAVTLSGGLDSTAVLNAAVAGLGSGESITAYTAMYDHLAPDGRPLDERESARLAMERYSDGVLREITADVDDLLAVLRRVVWHMDGPGFSPAVFPLWRIMESARADGVKVVLEGQGADEVLGGYFNHVAAALLGELEQALHSGGRGLMALGRAAREVPDAFSPGRVAIEMAGQVMRPVKAWDQRRGTLIGALAPDLVPVRPVAAPHGSAEDGRLRRRLLTDFCTDLLPAYLHYGDCISMAHSVESRLPFLDHRLVELCFTLPAGYKVREGVSKAILRDYLDQAGQRQIARERRKRGFPTPSHQWLAADGGAVLRDVLLDPGAATAPYLIRDSLDRAIKRHAEGMHAAGDVLFALLSTELWMQECLSAPAAPQWPAAAALDADGA